MPAPARTDSGRRLYDDSDLAVIRRMASLVDSGLSAASAAAAIHAEAAGATPAEVIRFTPDAIDSRVVALVQAAEQFDDLILLDMLGTAERSVGMEEALEQLALPALVEAGRRWEHGSFTVAQEHLLSEAIRTWLVFHTYAAPDAAPGAPRILVGCPEDERHDLTAFALALLLRRRGVRVAYVGADVPTAALVESVRNVTFDALCLTVTASPSLPIARLACAALLAARRNLRLYVGGRAITAAGAGADAIPAVRLPGNLRASADLIVSQLTRALR